MKKNIILSIEGSGEDFSVSLFFENNLLKEDYYSNVKNSEFILPAIQKILQQTNIKKEEIKAIFTTTGPGSFTSTRIALASVMALSFGLQIPFYTLDSLKTSALISKKEPQMAVIINAYNNKLYTAVFSTNSLKKEIPTTIKKLSIQKFLEEFNQDYCYIGNGVTLLKKKYNIQFQKETIPQNYLKSSLLAKYLLTVKNIENYKQKDIFT